MNFNICSLAIIILISSVFMMFFRDEDLFNTFMDSLDEKQQQLYNKIIKERTMIYLLGMFVGLVIGSIHFYYKRNICFFVCIVFVTQMIIYKIYPKSTYMLYHLDKKDQVNKWTDIYTYMKKIWISSFILSTIAYILFAYSFKF